MIEKNVTPEYMQKDVDWARYPRDCLARTHQSEPLRLEVHDKSYREVPKWRIYI